MSDVDITPEHLHSLADKHEVAAQTTESAALKGKSFAKQVEITHGVASTPSNEAFKDAQDARNAAAAAVQQASIDLAEKLRTAAGAYTSTDEQTGANVAKQVRPY